LDDPRPRFSPHELSEPIGTDAAPVAENVHRESSLVVYCGTDQQVGEGFAIALRIMGVDANFLPAGGAPATNSPNTEDH
jgi:hypothetical protein